MPNFQEFSGREFEDAQEAILDQSADLILVHDLSRVKGGDVLPEFARLKGFFAEQTPRIQRFWDEHRIPGIKSELSQYEKAIQTSNILPHLDTGRVIGYIASVNADNRARQFWASRALIPDLIDINTGRLDQVSRDACSLELANYEIPNDEWVDVPPGAGVLFGSLPWPAGHAARGEAIQVHLYSWNAELERKELNV